VADGRVVLVGEWLYVVAEREEPLEQPAGVIAPAGQHGVVGEPEAAGTDLDPSEWVTVT